MWRCFYAQDRHHEQIRIFSTYVEVFPLIKRSITAGVNFLHVCGGVSQTNCVIENHKRFSPRMWRCFQHDGDRGGGKTIFSTYVEVFPQHCMQPKHSHHFLHVCGGVSNSFVKPVLLPGFSPRMWRCFRKWLGSLSSVEIFSTYVEVFPRVRVNLS